MAFRILLNPTDAYEHGCDTVGKMGAGIPREFKKRYPRCTRMELRQEAPFAYKGIGPVIKTLSGAGIARPVAELEPIMTVMG